MEDSQAYELAYNQAIKYLSVRLHTTGELFDKLRKKKHPKDLAVRVIRRLEEIDFLNDQRFAQIFVENLKRYKSFGYYGIKAKLMQRKIPSEIIVSVLEEFLQVEEEMAVAKRFLAKLKRQQREGYAKLSRSMASKGFRTEVIREVLKEIPG